MARHRQEFQCIRTEGGLLPSDLLQRLADPKGGVPGSDPKDYLLAEGERLGEAVSASWNRLQKVWRAFRAAAESVPEGDGGLRVTNERWSLPLLRELGFGPLPPGAGKRVNERDYPIARFFHGTPIHLLGFRVSLDQRTPGERGAAAAAPHGMVQAFLNASEDSLWGILSNGLKLRILRDNQALSRQSYVEFDLEAMFDGEVYSDFVLLWLVAHATRFVPRAEGAGPETCWLEQWCRLAQEQGTRVLTDLRGGVEQALRTLGRGFAAHPMNGELRGRLKSGELTVADFHAQLLRVVYRLLFLFVAESRTVDGQPLLHPPLDRGGNAEARAVYAEHFSAARLRSLAGRIRGGRHSDLWNQFQVVVLALSGRPEGQAAREALDLPALGSFLWDPDRTADLNGALLANRDLLEAIRHLAFTTKDGALREVDFANLGSEELGGVYESLLGLTPRLLPDGSLDFEELAGSQRKTSGSYYTPDDLVQLLLDSALDPVVREATRGKRGQQAEQAILGLKVLDPAVGSGHFLVGAARRLARHLAEARASARETEPSPSEYQRALRDVAGRCLYGVDLNPMAAELCRVSLWLEALEPGKPLSFLEHHILVGDSILGATPELVAGGIPDAAYKPLEGDDPAVCRQLDKTNKAARDELGTLFDQGRFAGEEYLKLFENLETAGDADIGQRRRKERLYEDARKAVAMRWLASDLWTAAFLCPKTEFDAVPTTADLRRVLRGEALAPKLGATVRDTAKRYRLFHYHLAFPRVFAQGGFDVVLGNPPWEKVKLQQREFFAQRDCAIANARSKDLRERLVSELERACERARRERSVDEEVARKAELYAEFLEAQREAQSKSKFLGSGGRFPLGAVGDVNTYLVFTELASQLLAPNGMAGLLVPTGVATAAPSSALFSSLAEEGRIAFLYDFENGSRPASGSVRSVGTSAKAEQDRTMFFPEVDSRFTFCLFGLAGTARTDLGFPAAFGCHNVGDVKDTGRIVRLDARLLRKLNPETGTAPVFRSGRAARLLVGIAERVPPFVSPDDLGGNPWGAKFACMFHMSNDSFRYRFREELEDAGGVLDGSLFRVSKAAPAGGRPVRAGGWLPLWEAKLVHQFDHRWATYGTPSEPSDRVREATDEEKADPSFEVLPRHWVHERDVAEWRQRPTWRDSDDPSDRSAWRRLQSGLGWWLGWREVTNATNERTSIWAVVPAYASNNKLQLCLVAEPPPLEACLLALANSLAFDWCVRQKLNATDFTFTVLRQLPVLPPQAFLARPDGGPGGRGEPPDRLWVGWIARRSVALTFSSRSVEPFARACGYTGGPFRWDPALRRRLRVQLDSALFFLYGVGRDDAAWMMDEFAILKAAEEKAFGGRYAYRDEVLDAMDALEREGPFGPSLRTTEVDDAPFDWPPLERPWEDPR